MYKSRKGQSGSTRPHVTDAPEWSNTDKEAVQSSALDLAKSGMSTAEIGTVLRDKHAVPNARLVLGKRIGQFLAENDMMGAYPEDMMNLMRQAVAIINHLGSGNHKDIHNKRALKSPNPKSADLLRTTSAKTVSPATGGTSATNFVWMVE